MLMSSTEKMWRLAVEHLGHSSFSVLVREVPLVDGTLEAGLERRVQPGKQG